MSETTPPAALAPAAGAGLARQWALVLILALIYLLAFMDRYSLTLIANPIMDELHITRVELSLLAGISFVALYSILSIPAGYLADILDRRVMLCAAGVLWSSMAVVSGFAGSYAQLFAGRLGLGIGEAALPPVAYSLIRDGVRPAHRARAFGVYQLGGILGAGVGALVGGTLYALADKGALAGVPILGHLRPWQVVIALPGLCGIPLSFLLLAIREPARTQPAAGSASPSFGELYRYARQEWRIYLPLVLATILGGLSLSGWMQWLPSLLNRTWDLPIAELGQITGTLTLVGAPVSLILISWLMDRFSRGRSPAAAVWVSLVGSAISAAFSIGIVLAPTLPVMWACYGLSVVITGGYVTAPATVIAHVTPSQLIGKVTSFYYLISNLLGFALGPTLFAEVSEHVFEGPRALPDAMLLCYAVLSLGSWTCFALLARAVARWRPGG